MPNKNNKIKEIKSLVDMLDEPDEDLFNEISSHIVQFEIEAIPFLEDCANDFLKPLSKLRAENLIIEIRLKQAVEELKKWKHSEKQSTLEAWIIIEKLLYSSLNFDTIIRKIENISKEIWGLTESDAGPIEVIESISDYLFGVLGLKVEQNLSNYNSYMLHKLTKNYSTNIITAAMLYVEIAQKNNIPIYGQIADEAVLLAWKNIENNEFYNPIFDNNKAILYIALHSGFEGAILSDYQFNKGLTNKHYGIEPFKKLLDNVDLFNIYLKNLHSVLENNEKLNLAQNIKTLLNALNA